MFEWLETNELIICKPIGYTETGCGTNRKRCTFVKAVDKDKDLLLIVSLSSLPDDFFAIKALVTPCILEKNSKIKTNALLDTAAAGYFFVNPPIVHRICDKLLIEPIRLSKPKPI